MHQLRVAFWNVENLFAAGAVDRGPQTEDELHAKLGVLGDTIDSFFDGHGPDLLGLAEVGSERELQRLRAELTDAYLLLWEPATRGDNTGLGLLARESAFSEVRIEAAERLGDERPRCIVVRCDLRGMTVPFIAAVVHWKSGMPHGGTPISPEQDRLNSGRWLGDYLGAQNDINCALVVGDFNAEPDAPPFGKGHLRGRRHFSSALCSIRTPAELYNTAWRYMHEPDYFEKTTASGYQEPRPKTTHVSSHEALFDQLLVSGRALRGGPISLCEETVSYHCDDCTSEHSAQGLLRPLRWSYCADDGTHAGASDHLPLLATFAVNKGI
ncbi:MAG TPA: hypothetical protein DGT21_21385 [Armatimonadetes bacterium]|jgi:exonuclease III|nr:hypothetical protein [Armatimonadota bacterium]